MTPSVATRPALSPGESPPSLFAIGVSSPLKGGWSIGAWPSGLIAPSDLVSVAALPTNSPSPHAPTFRQNWRGHRADHRCGLRAVADLYHVLRDRTGRPTNRTDRRRDVRRGPGKLSPAPPAAESYGLPCAWPYRRQGFGAMTFGEQNSEAEGRAQMDYAFHRGINIFDAAEIYPIPPKPETQGPLRGDHRYLACRKVGNVPILLVFSCHCCSVVLCCPSV